MLTNTVSYLYRHSHLNMLVRLTPVIIALFATAGVLATATCGDSGMCCQTYSQDPSVGGGVVCW